MCNYTYSHLLFAVLHNQTDSQSYKNYFYFDIDKGKTIFNVYNKWRRPFIISHVNHIKPSLIICNHNATPVNDQQYNND